MNVNFEARGTPDVLVPALDLLGVRGAERTLLIGLFKIIARRFNQLSHEEATSPSISHLRTKLQMIADAADALAHQIDELPEAVLARMAKRDGFLGPTTALDREGHHVLGHWLDDISAASRGLRDELQRAGGPGKLIRLDSAHEKACLAATCAELAIEFCPDLIDRAWDKGLLPLAHSAFEFATGQSIEDPGAGIDHHVKETLRCYRAMLKAATAAIGEVGGDARQSSVAYQLLCEARDLHVVGRTVPKPGKQLGKDVDPGGPKLFPFGVALSIGGRTNLGQFR